MLPLLISVGCKKKEKQVEPAPVEKTTPQKTATAVAPAPKEEPASLVPDVELSDSPSKNLIAVFSAGTMAIQSASPKDAATIINGLLEKFDVADLRAKSKAAKESGAGASKEEVAKYKELQEKYKARADELGKEDAAAFAPAAEAWAAAWGIK